MSVRSLDSRLTKLETVQSRGSDEMLVIWRQPGSDVRAAVAAAGVRLGNRAICAEWTGEDAMPAPRWYKMDEVRHWSMPHFDQLFEAVQRVGGMEDVDRLAAGFAAVPFHRADKVQEMTDAELIYFVLGVAA